MSTGCHVCIYSQDSLGLGHLRRNILIGEALLNARKDCNVLLLADSPVAPFFKLPDRMDHVKLPCIRKVSADCWEATRLRMDEQELIRIRADLLLNVLLNFRPDVVLVDHMPGGAQGELLPAVRALKEACPTCSIVLGLRDILDAPEVTQRVWESEGAYEALRRYYDRILIYGNKEMFTTCSTYRLPIPLKGTHYCGYVVKQDMITPLRNLRQTLGLPKNRFVFVSAGGGGDGQLLMQTYVRAIRILGSRAKFTTLMAVGVNAPPDFAPKVASETRGLPIRIRPYVDDSASCIAGADLVVCMAGYNTLSEVLYFHKKSLVVPRGGPSAEQRTRAGLFALHHLIDMLDPADLSPEKLAERLLEDLERSDYPSPNVTLRMDGAEHAADRLSELLQVQNYASSA